MNCACMNWCRIPTDNLPPSDHHSNCSEYKPEPFLRLEHDGSSCVMEPHEARGIIEDADDGHGYTVSEVRMTREQFDALPDFGGF